MVNAVGAYQQTSQLQSASQTLKSREELTTDRRTRDQTDESVRVARTKDTAETKTADATKTTEDRRQNAVNDQTTQAAGKDSAQRRGSLLDVVA
jgi:hypothetical protein